MDNNQTENNRNAVKKKSKARIIVLVVLSAVLGVGGIVGLVISKNAGNLGGGASKKSFSKRVRELEYQRTYKSDVNRILGEPDEKSDGAYTYYNGSGYNEYKKLQKQIDELGMKILQASDINELEKLMKQSAVLETKAESITYAYTVITFDSGNCVSTVLYDAAYKENNAPLKDIDSYEIVASDMLYFETSCNVVYKSEFKDGSYYLNSATAVTEGNNAVSDMTVKNVKVNWTDEYYDGYSRNVVFSTPKGGYYYRPDDSKIIVVKDGVNVSDRLGNDRTGIKNIEIADGVTYVVSNAFRNMTALESVTAASTLNHIEIDAFEGCSHLKIYESGNCLYVGNEQNNHLILLQAKDADVSSVTVDASAVVIAKDAFDVCDELTELNVASDNAKYVSSGNCIICKADKTLLYGCKNSTVPNDGSVTKIAATAFKDCKGLTALSVPASVVEIDLETFSGCDALATLTVDEDNSVFSASGNCLIERKEKTLVYCCKNSTVPNDGSVAKIAASAFKDYKELTSFTVPASVTEIDASAFADCDALGNLSVADGNKTFKAVDNCIIAVKNKELVLGCKNSVIPTDGSVTKIGKSAFEGCNGIYSLNIPDKITEIGERAFFGCDNIVRITVPKSVKKIGEDAFYANLIISLEIKKEYNEEYNYTHEYGWYGDNTSRIWDYKNNNTDDAGFIHAEIGGLFYRLKENYAYVVRQPRTISGKITIPNTVTFDNKEYKFLHIDEYAFAECKGITELTVLGATISDNAFKNCTGLQTVTYTYGGGSVSDDAFIGCTNIKFLTCDVERLYYVYNIVKDSQNVILTITGEGSINAGSNSYLIRCNVTEVVITDGITQISQDAFRYCTALQKITIPSSVTTIGKYAFSCTSLKSVFIPASVTKMGYEVFYDCSSDLKVYCEASEQPNGYDSQWDVCGWNPTAYVHVFWGSTGIPE